MGWWEMWLSQPSAPLLWTSPNPTPHPGWQWLSPWSRPTAATLGHSCDLLHLSCGSPLACFSSSRASSYGFWSTRRIKISEVAPKNKLSPLYGNYTLALLGLSLHPKPFDHLSWCFLFACGNFTVGRMNSCSLPSDHYKNAKFSNINSYCTPWADLLIVLEPCYGCDMCRFIFMTLFFSQSKTQCILSSQFSPDRIVMLLCLSHKTMLMLMLIILLWSQWQTSNSFTDLW